MFVVELVFVNIVQRIFSKALENGQIPCNENKQYNIFCLAIVSLSTLFKQNFVHGLKLGLVQATHNNNFITTRKL
jgi:hypothetical protein